jgi:hypothetical protein
VAKWKATERVYVKGLGYDKGKLPDGVEPEQWQIDRGLVVKDSGGKKE